MEETTNNNPPENTEQKVNSAGKEPIEVIKGTINYEIKLYDDGLEIVHDKGLNNDIAVNCIMNLNTQSSKELLSEAFNKDKGNKVLADRLNSAGQALKWLRINFDSLYAIKIRNDEIQRLSVKEEPVLTVTKQDEVKED